MAIDAKMEELTRKQEEARSGGGAQKIEAQHAKKKLTARERANLLFDSGTFQEIDSYMIHGCTDFGMEKTHYLGDSVVIGYGKVNGCMVYAYFQEFTVFGGSLSKVAAEKICRIMDMAAKNGAPVVGVLDSGGARIQEGTDSLDGYGDIFTRNTLYSGVVPQISVVLGPTAGGAVYSPAITDFVFMGIGIGQSYITGPAVVKAVTGEDVSLEDLGGAIVNATKSGNAHFALPTEVEVFVAVRKLLSFLPQNNQELADFQPTDDDAERREEELLNIVPSSPNQPYDMKKIINLVIDNADFFEVHQRFARNFIVGFARIDGRSVGILAQQPMFMAGVLDIDASDKAARFVRFCDAFNIPLVTFVDVPGYMPGTDMEYRGIIRHGAKLLFAYAEATVPKVSVVTRKAYGGAYIAMSSKHLRGDICYAWPTAEIAVMGPEGAVDVLYRRELKASDNPAETRAKLIQEFREKFANPYTAAMRGAIDDVIDPRDTRIKIIKALEMLETKDVTNPAKKHGNIPL